MFLGDTQKKEILIDLRFVSGDSNDIQLIIKDIEENGVNSAYISCTDPDQQQFCVQITDDVFLYSQQHLFFYNWDQHSEKDIGEYYTQTYDLKEYQDEEIEEKISGYYDSLEKLKSELPNEWKQIAIECIFEQEAESVPFLNSNVEHYIKDNEFTRETSATTELK